MLSGERPSVDVQRPTSRTSYSETHEKQLTDPPYHPSSYRAQSDSEF